MRLLMSRADDVMCVRMLILTRMRATTWQVENLLRACPAACSNVPCQTSSSQSAAPLGTIFIGTGVAAAIAAVAIVAAVYIVRKRGKVARLLPGLTESPKTQRIRGQASPSSGAGGGGLAARRGFDTPALEIEQGGAKATAKVRGSPFVLSPSQLKTRLSPRSPPPKIRSYASVVEESTAADERLTERRNAADEHQDPSLKVTRL